MRESVRKVLIAFFLILGAFKLVQGDMNKAMLAIGVAVVWTRQFDEFVLSLFRRK